MKKGKKTATLPVLIEQDENGMYVGSVPSLRSCYTQGRTLVELYKNLQEAVELSMEAEKEFFGEKPGTNRIIGFQNLQFKV
jgi:predicted RNase H-like HicB family nuclease